VFRSTPTASPPKFWSVYMLLGVELVNIRDRGARAMVETSSRRAAKMIFRLIIIAPLVSPV
jgi:hypothetical protein